MQKNYIVNPHLSSEVLAERQKDEVVQLQRKLKSLYGEKLELIVEKGKLTCQEYGAKCGEGGEGKSKTLMDHIDTAITWAAEVGAVPLEKAILVGTGKQVRIPRRSTEETLAYLNKVANSLAQRVDNIRGYVVKLTKPDLFFAEKLEDLEETVLLNVQSDACKAFVASMAEALRNGGIDIETTASSSASGGNAADRDVGVETIKGLVENIRSIIPIPRNKEEEKEAMLAHLNRIRAACQVCVNYCTLTPEHPNMKLQLAGSLRQVHEAVYESVTFLREIYREDRTREGDSNPGVLLEDAWNKVMDYDKDINDATAIDTVDASDSIPTDGDSAAKSLANQTVKKGPKPIVIRSKMLFTTRLPPQNLLDAMKRKQAILCGDGNSSYLKLQFGQAFEMYIYFSPLLVSIRAMPEKEDHCEKSEFRKNVVDCKQGTWIPSSFGLKTTPLPTTTSNVPGRKRTVNGQIKTKQTVSIMGISGDVALLGPIVAKRLDYASAQATRCLRRCFADHTTRAYKSNSDFEIEISEGNAVLKFLQLARKIYQADSLVEEGQ